jgi:two-component system, LuxR family, sensor histidine kinase DctS
LLIEADGSRLAAYGASKRRGDKFAAQSLLDLPGVTLILRVETWIAAPFWLANTPTALVLALALALGVVLWLLFRDTRKRLRTEAEFRQSQERLQRSARLATLGEMASMLSHELNQPLAAIASYATGSLNLLETEPHALDIYEIKMALERIATQSQRAGQVIKSVNDFVRRREADRSAIAPKALFDAILPLLTLQARQYDIRLIVQASPDLPRVWCDKTLIEQVLINLARNGMQAMQTLSSDAGVKVLTMTAQTSAIDVHAAVTANHANHVTDSIEFWIEDTGPGISSEVQEKLFTPFFTTKEEGTGLGLSLCRTAIEQHGSNLTYTSNKGARTGARFGFQLKIHMGNPSL